MSTDDFIASLLTLALVAAWGLVITLLIWSIAKMVREACYALNGFFTCKASRYAEQTERMRYEMAREERNRR